MSTMIGNAFVWALLILGLARCAGEPFVIPATLNGTWSGRNINTGVTSTITLNADGTFAWDFPAATIGYYRQGDIQMIIAPSNAVPYLCAFGYGNGEVFYLTCGGDTHEFRR